jgi:uncharacterized protein
MSGFIDLIIPKEKKFFELLKKQIDLLQKSATDAYKLSKNKQITKDKLTKTIKLLKKQREQSSQIAEEITQGLRHTFITPIDSSEILHLTSNIYGVSACIDKTISALVYLKLDNIDQFYASQLTMIKEMTGELYLVFNNLLLKTNRQHLANIFTLEDKADIVYREAYDKMFTDCIDPVEIIKRKELYDLGEKTIDDIKSIADKIESILINHS